MLRFLVHVLFTFYIQGVLKFLNKFGGLRVTGLEWPRGFQEVKVPRFIYIYIYKGKTVPLQAWSDPEGSRKLRFSDFMTTAQEGGKVVSLTHQPPLPPRKYTWYSSLLEAESTPGP